MKIPTWLPYGVFDSRFLAHIQAQVPSCVVYMWDFTTKGSTPANWSSFAGTSNRPGLSRHLMKEWKIDCWTLILRDQQKKERDDLIRSTVEKNMFFINTREDITKCFRDNKYAGPDLGSRPGSESSPTSSTIRSTRSWRRGPKRP
jgi:hypothetical protein